VSEPDQTIARMHVPKIDKMMAGHQRAAA